MKKQISEMQSRIVMLDENMKNSISTEKVTNKLINRRNSSANSSINFVKSSETQNLSMKNSSKSSDTIQPFNTQNVSLKEPSQLSNANKASSTQNIFPISHLMSFNEIHPLSTQNASINPQSLQSYDASKPSSTQNASIKPQSLQSYDASKPPSTQNASMKPQPLQSYESIAIPQHLQSYDAFAEPPILIKNSSNQSSANPPSSGSIKLVIQNMRCTDILALDNEMPYPYLIFTVNKSAFTKRMTSVIPGCLNPFWPEKLVISINDWNNDVLSVNLFTDDGLYNAKLMNELNIPVNTWPIGNRVNFVENIKLGNEKAGVLYMTIDVLKFN